MEIGEKTNSNIIDDKTLELIHSKYIYFPTSNCRMNMTRALGHYGISDEADNATIPFEKGYKYTIFTATDGVGDMMQIDGGNDLFVTSINTSVGQIAEWAKKRWEQVWKFKGYHDKWASKFPEGSTDDISCAKFIHRFPVV